MLKLGPVSLIEDSDGRNLRNDLTSNFITQLLIFNEMYKNAKTGTYFTQEEKKYIYITAQYFTWSTLHLLSSS